MLLAIETATQQLGVAVTDGDKLLSSYEVLAENPHAAELPDAVKRVMAAAHTTLEKLEAIAVDIGPGSFTGLRIGLAFVKAIAFTKKMRVVGVPSLDVLAAGIPFVGERVLPMLDAKRKNVYACLYRIEDGNPVRQTDYLLQPIDEVLGNIKEPVVFLGDGCLLYREQILKRLGSRARFAGQDLWLPRAATLARLGRRHLEAQKHDDPASLVPMYLYPRDCQVRRSESTPSVGKTLQGV